MKLADYLGKDDILPSLTATSRDDVLAELATALASRHPELMQEEVLQVLTEREQLGSTGIGDGIAIPHGKLHASGELVLLFARSTPGVAFGALDGRPVQLFFVLLAPQSAAGMHLKMLARISRILKDPAVRRDLVAATDVAAIFTTIMDQDSRH
jgi:PTS system nitrogen regulatory IIA component